MIDKIIYLQSVISFSLFSIGSLFLFLKAEGQRARKILALVMAAWAVFFAASVINNLFVGKVHFQDRFFSPSILIIGTFYVISILPFAFEIIRPGWISVKRFSFLLLPWMFTSMLYYCILKVLHEPIIELYDFPELLNNFSDFNVWFRFILFLIIFVYITVLHLITIRYRSLYNEWCLQNYANVEQMDISWLKYFAAGMLVISLNYGLAVFNVSSLVYVFHQIALQFVFGLAFYKMLFHKNPYSENFFKDGMNEEKTYQIENDSKKHPDNLFKENLPFYKETVENWMQSSHPYLHSDFKLMDAGEVLPLNRSYLSRVFNEGFGVSFSQYVQDFRIEQSKTLLTSERNLTINEIAYKSGFASSSAFHSAFIKKTGLTPKKFRELN